MLDFAYVYSLENRYKKYKKRQYIRITMYILFLFVLCITIATLLFLQKEEKSVLITNKNIQDNATTANDDTIKKTSTINNNLESNLILSDEKRQSTIQSSTDNSKREIIGSDKIKFFMLSSPTTSQNIVKFNRLELSNMDNNSSSKDVDIVDMHGPNNMIINISGDIDKNAEFFENRYFETSNVTFALLASVEHYEDQKYKESLKWALIANEQDPKSEQSWEMFALSNVKLNKRNDAINALESYLRSNKSVKLERLLNRIKKGELK